MGPLLGQISGPILGPFCGPNFGPQIGALLINLIQTLRFAGSFWSREMDPKSAPESNPKRPNLSFELSPQMASKLARSARSGARAAPSKRYGMKPVRGHWPDKDMGSFAGERLLGSRKEESFRSESNLSHCDDACHARILPRFRCAHRPEHFLQRSMKAHCQRG